ncbi:MAG TPA: superoxide dismutase [Candidatus Sulfotelmatobacter sp.]|nr:superoxide dismutase [Candidatus Sulfotelmatobacter sp.]
MFTLPDLDYPYDGLEGYISKKIMQLHHDKHHQTYVDNLNKAVDAAPQLNGKTIEELLVNLDAAPEEVRMAIRNHGGGHYNHSMFWKIMAPKAGGEPSGKLAEDLKAKYSSYESFVEQFSEKAVKIFGSGWAWLMPDLSIETRPNQDNPIMDGKPAPILGLDVWEHAYYLDYTFKRPDYVKAWWNVVNWDEVGKRYSA